MEFELENDGNAGKIYGLLDHLDRSFRTLHFAGPAHQAFIGLHRNRLLVFDFINCNRARINTCSTPSALSVINNNLDHFKFHPMLFFHSEQESKIKAFRCN